MNKKIQQPPMTVEEQLENLKLLGLLIDNEESAKKFLNDVSYFRLIKAYSLGLKEKNGMYYDGVTFNEIVELYLFNSNFRQLLFAQIERVEINLRCRLANYFSNKYGVLGYENANNFDNEEYHNQFKEDIATEISRNTKAPFVKNFSENYFEGKIPFYALIELFSFGTLSKFFKNMKNEDKKSVSKSFNIGYTYFESWIESIAFARNICAHYGRLYNAKLAKTPILYKEYDKLQVNNNRVFAVLVCMKHILPNDRHWKEFVETIDLLLEKYAHVKKELIGFPDDWKKILEGFET